MAEVTQFDVRAGELGDYDFYIDVDDADYNLTGATIRLYRRSRARAASAWSAWEAAITVGAGGTNPVVLASASTGKITLQVRSTSYFGAVGYRYQFAVDIDPSGSAPLFTAPRTKDYVTATVTDAALA